MAFGDIGIQGKAPVRPAEALAALTGSALVHASARACDLGATGRIILDRVRRSGGVRRDRALPGAGSHDPMAKELGAMIPWLKKSKHPQGDGNAFFQAHCCAPRRFAVGPC